MGSRVVFAVIVLCIMSTVPFFAAAQSGLKGSNTADANIRCALGHNPATANDPEALPEGAECFRDYESCQNVQLISGNTYSRQLASVGSAIGQTDKRPFIRFTCQEGKCVATNACEGFELELTDIPSKPLPPVKEDIPQIPTDSTVPDLAEVLPPDAEVLPQPPPEVTDPVLPPEIPAEDVTPNPLPPRPNPGTVSNLRPPRPPSTFGGGDTPWGISPYPFQESTFGGGGWSSGGSDSANGFFNLFSNIVSSLFGVFGGGGGGGGGSSGGGWGSGGQSNNVSRPPSPFQVADAGDANQAARDLLEKIKKAQNEIRVKKGLDPIPELQRPQLEDRIGIPSGPPREPISGGSPRIPLEDIFRQERLDNSPPPRSEVQDGTQVAEAESETKTDGPPPWWPPGREWVPPAPPPSAKEVAGQRLRDALQAHEDARNAWDSVPFYRKILGFAGPERDRLNKAIDNLNTAIGEYGDQYAPEKPQYAEWESAEDLATGEWRHRIARCLLGEGTCAGEAPDVRRIEVPPPAEPLDPGGIVPGLAENAKIVSPQAASKQDTGGRSITRGLDQEETVSVRDRFTAGFEKFRKTLRDFMARSEPVPAPESPKPPEEPKPPVPPEVPTEVPAEKPGAPKPPAPPAVSKADPTPPRDTQPVSTQPDTNQRNSFAQIPMQWLAGILSALANWFGGDEASDNSSTPVSETKSPPPVIAAASITANPNPVKRDARARLAWASVGTGECAVVDSLLNVLARDVSGAIDTARLQESTRFGVICDIENGSDKYVNEVLVRVEGDESDPPNIFAQTGRVSRAPAVQGGDTAGGASSRTGSNGQNNSPVSPRDVRVCQPPPNNSKQSLNAFIRCLCDVEPNPNGCALVPR